MIRLRVGIAGYGVVGRRRRQYIDAHPAMQTVAVCDRTFESEGTLPDGVRHYRTYARLLEAEALDVLFVCMTNDIAAEATIAGLSRNLHVFCEKPPGRDLEDIASVIRVERARPGVKLKYGFNHRYHESVRDALRLVQSGELGRVLNLRGIYGKSQIINFGSSDWRSKRAISGGGILLDQGIHLVDLIRLFAGEFEHIHSFIANDFWHHDVEDNVYAMMRTREGVVAMVQSSATQWRHRFNLDITLEGGQIILAGILSGSKSYGAETMTVAWKSDDGNGDPREQTIRYNHDPSWADEIAEFAACILGDQPVENGSSREALSTMHLVYRIYCADAAWKARWKLADDLPGDLA